jgi:8-oxo-dGTP diphosphatase
VVEWPFSNYPQTKDIDSMGAAQQGADVTQNRWMTVPRTLCFVFHGDEILLMKRGAHKKIFPNQYNGLGGHIERDEDPLTSARREILEESGLDVENLRLCAVYNIDAGHATGIILFVFAGESLTREELPPSPEGTLHWFALDQLHTLDMVEDIAFIVPRILALPAGVPPLFIHVSYDAADQLQMRVAGE